MAKISIALISCILLMSCSQSKKMSAPGTSLYQKWDLISVNGLKITGHYAHPVYIDFDESQSRVSGSAACNRYFGSFTRSGASIAFGPLGSTKMMCDESSNKLEAEFLQALGKVDAYKIEENQLLLLNNKEVVARFEQSKAIPDELAGKWNLFFITGPRITFEGLYPDTKPSVTFTSGTNQFTGNTGCNSISGTFNGTKGAKLFSPGISTLKACPGAGEQTFMSQFQNVDRYEVNADTLTFFRDNVPAMKFSKTQ